MDNRILIDYIVFYAVSKIFRAYNGGIIEVCCVINAVSAIFRAMLGILWHGIP